MVSLSFAFPLAAAGQLYAAPGAYTVPYNSAPYGVPTYPDPYGVPTYGVPTYPDPSFQYPAVTTSYPGVADIGVQYAAPLAPVYHTAVDPYGGFGAFPAGFGGVPADLGATPAGFGATPAGNDLGFGATPAGNDAEGQAAPAKPENAPAKPENVEAPKAKASVLMPPAPPKLDVNEDLLDAIKHETKESLIYKLGKQRNDQLLSAAEQNAEQKHKIQTFFKNKLDEEMKSIDKKIEDQRKTLASNIAQLEEQRDQLKKASQDALQDLLAQKKEELAAHVANMADPDSVEAAAESLLKQQIAQKLPAAALGGSFGGAPMGKNQDVANKIASWKQELGR
jgi:hypothetical protein